MRLIASLAAVAALAACGTVTNTNTTNNTTAVTNANVAANNQTNGNAAQTANANAPATSATATNPPTAEAQASDGAARISVNELRDMMARNTAVVVDVRGEGQHNAGYIKGSLWIPEAEIVARRAELPRDKKIVTYCS